jgi:hypothetical protein
VTDPKRLADEDDLGGTLLGSARTDRPRDAARDRTAAALGLAAIVVIGSESRATGSTGGTGMGPGATTKSVGASVWLKIIGGALVAVAIAGGVFATAKGLRRGGQASGSFVRSGPAAETQISARPPVPIEAPLATSTTNASSQGGSDWGRGKPSRTGVTTAGESPLARELRALDAVRSALDHTDVAEALRDLDQYDHAFPSGALRTEAGMLRIDALLARGDDGAARKLARDLLTRDPSGPHARRLRAIVEIP